MYRRYSTDYRGADSFADGGRNGQAPSGNERCENPQQHSCDRPHTAPRQARCDKPHPASRQMNCDKPPAPHREKERPQGKSCGGDDGRGGILSLLKFIPQSIYDPETGKVLGFMSAEDLLLAALILVLLDNKCEDEDNSMLIYALLYILLSDHINLPI
ncbi:MAG: hypothetical protein Q4E94_03085 [Clostridia bacterium]|nr:hypothetical protein [Clostridia bacterium]